MDPVKTLDGLTWGVAQTDTGSVLFITIEDEEEPDSLIYINIAITVEDLEYALAEFRKGHKRILN